MTAPRASVLVFLGISLVTLSTLALQIGITRIFSAVLWYHFAFLAISVALFGSGAAGQWVYLSKRGIDADTILDRLQSSAIAYSVAVPLAFLAFSHQVELTAWLEAFGLQEIGRWTLTYVVFAIPFFFAGSCVTLALSAFREDVSRLCIRPTSSAPDSAAWQWFRCSDGWAGRAPCNRLPSSRRWPRCSSAGRRRRGGRPSPRAWLS